jgi:hypothetical protein
MERDVNGDHRPITIRRQRVPRRSGMMSAWSPPSSDRTGASKRGGLVLLLATTSFAYFGCLDLTVPPNVGEDAAPDGRPADAVDAATRTTGGAGGGVQGGSGGQAGSGDAPGSGGIADAGLGGAGGGKGGSGGSTDALVVATGGSGGNADAFVGGTGGMGTGGSSGSQDGAAGQDGRTDAGEAIGPSDASPEASVDAPMGDIAPDGPEPLRMGLVVYYPCEQSEGTMLRDRSGSGNHGTLQTGSGSSDSGYRFESGKIGNALTLVQSGGGYVSLPTAAFTGSADLTVATWIKLNTFTPWQRLFDVGINANLAQNTATGTVYMTLFLKDFANKLGLGSTKDGFSNAEQVTTDPLPTGTWKHIAVVLAGGAATIYIDGTAMSMVNPFLPPQALGTLDYAFLGKSQFSTDPYLDAQIDDFRVYSRALSASEVQALVQYVGP